MDDVHLFIRNEDAVDDRCDISFVLNVAADADFDAPRTDVSVTHGLIIIWIMTSSCSLAEHLKTAHFSSAYISSH